MAQLLERQGYRFYACDECRFAYKDQATADQCKGFDLANGMRSADITGKSIAPPDRYWQAVLKFIEEEQKAARAAAAKPAAPASAPATPGAEPAKPAPPKLTPEELEARKKAALEKAAAMKAQKEAQA
ncbi:MAG: hypothetical protein LC624_02900 [Halobacteriales archaeon]|nr:hypothetical protein [Halobacteriales archaeon]